MLSSNRPVALTTSTTDYAVEVRTDSVALFFKYEKVLFLGEIRVNMLHAQRYPNMRRKKNRRLPLFDLFEEKYVFT